MESLGFFSSFFFVITLCFIKLQLLSYSYELHLYLLPLEAKEESYQNDRRKVKNKDKCVSGLLQHQSTVFSAALEYAWDRLLWKLKTT